MAPLLTLVGFMGSGKTSIGARVAELLSWRFRDLDQEVGERSGTSIPDIFAREGEASFRKRECDALGDLLSDGETEKGFVLALGGGTLESEAARETLAGRGAIIYLEVEPAEAWARVVGTGRPLAQSRAGFEQLLARRRATYEQLANWIVRVDDREIETIAREVVDIVKVVNGRLDMEWGRRVTSAWRPSYIRGGTGVLDSLAVYAAEARRHGTSLFVITDENVAEAVVPRATGLMADALGEGSMLVLPAGETTKTASMLEKCWDWLSTRNARRDDTVVALGGGVIGDLAGFAAATYRRGLNLWQVPTSLLAQVDSSVGGKTGIDLTCGKNLVGAFYHPDLVLIDPDVLSTLPEVEYANGLGEVVKYGLLVPGSLFSELEREAAALLARDPRMLASITRQCVTYKAKVVENDEFDRHGRAALNLGHTIGHALEVTMGYGTLSHGRAVGLGLLVALTVSERMVGLDPGVRARARDLMETLRLPVGVSLPPTEAMLEAISRDKKVVAATMGFVGLRSLGEPVLGMDVPRKVIVDALEAVRQ